jgi:hypothetical protein
MSTNIRTRLVSIKDLLYHEKNCGEPGELLCYDKPEAIEAEELCFPYCLLHNAVDVASEKALRKQEEINDMFTPLEEFKTGPYCDTEKVKEAIGTGCTDVMPNMDGELRTTTDEGYDLEVNLNEFVGMGKECVIHESTRQCATAVIAICSIEPENVTGVDDSKMIYKLEAEPYTRRFNGQITENQKDYVTKLMGKFDKYSVQIVVASEIFAWVGIRPRDSLFAKSFTRAYCWVTITDYFGGKDVEFHKGLRKGHDLLTTGGRPTSMIYNSLSCTLIRAECQETKKHRCHLDDKWISRAYQTATTSIVDAISPNLPNELLNYWAVSMAQFTDAIDVVHDYHKCPSANGLEIFVVRGYCIRSAILASYRRTLQVLPEELKKHFRESIKGVMYACVTSGRHYVMEQTIGCHCDDENRVCKKWNAKNCKYFVDDEDGEDYMDLFTSKRTEPTFADRDKLIAKIYTYLQGKVEFEDLFNDEDLDAKVAWIWERLQHTCMIHKCPHSEGNDKRR